MKKYIFIAAGFLVTAFVVACGSNNSMEPNNTQIQCPVGTVLQNGTCVGIAGGSGVQGPVGFYSENTHTKSLQTTGNFKEFLRDAMGVCDRGHSDGGLADCQAWESGIIDVVIQAPSPQSSTLRVTFRAVPRRNPYGAYYYSLPSAEEFALALLGFPVLGSPGAYLPKLQLDMVVSVTNNYQGFEARGFGDINSKANRSLIQIQIPQGKLEDGYFAYRIAFRNQIIASGQFIRCSTADCRVNEPLQ